MVGLKWTTQAIEDVEAICAFIAKDSTIYACLFVKDILQAVKQLGNFPKSGRMVPEFCDKNVREIILGNYRIIYRIKFDAIEILTIYHSARLLKIDI